MFFSYKFLHYFVLAANDDSPPPSVYNPDPPVHTARLSGYTPGSPVHKVCLAVYTPGPTMYKIDLSVYTDARPVYRVGPSVYTRATCAGTVRQAQINVYSL